MHKILLRLIRTIVVICLAVAGFHTVIAQPTPYRGIKGGINVNTLGGIPTSSFSNTPSFTINVFTGVSLFSIERSSLLLEFELGFSRLYRYKMEKDIIEHMSVGAYVSTYDKRFTYSLFGLGLFPGCYYAVTENFTIGAFAGGALGAGNEDATFHRRTATLLNPYSSGGYGAFGEYEHNKPPFGLYLGFETGMAFRYKLLLLDLRYSKAAGVESCFIQLGVATW